MFYLVSEVQGALCVSHPPWGHQQDRAWNGIPHITILCIQRNLASAASLTRPPIIRLNVIDEIEKMDPWIECFIQPIIFSIFCICLSYAAQYAIILQELVL